MSSDPVSLDTPSATSPATPSVGSRAPVAKNDGVRQQVKKLAEEFEAMLVTQMLRDMRKSMIDAEEEEQGGFGAGAMNDTVDVELGRSLSRTGGFGLAKQLMKALEHQIEAKVDAKGAVASSAPESTAPVSAPRAVGPTPGDVVIPSSTPLTPSPVQPISSSVDDPIAVPAGRVTSEFGWRRDPFTGGARFHKGVDVAMAYGTGAQAAAAGRVVFAGEQGGYGNTVVIQHASGDKTRYAHLASAGVHAGEEVGAGQVIGRAGHSGRATGSHLHFEVISGGRAVKPTEAGD